MIKIGALVSGGGTNLQAIIDACESGYIDGKVVSVVSSKDGVYALERAEKHSIEGCVINKKMYGDDTDDVLIKHFQDREVDLIVLAGYMTILGEKFVNAFKNRIMNIHPALIPSFCGDGFYGLHVHEAALKKGVKISGATVHFVSPITDGGPIILQKAVEVRNDDTPETLQKRIMEEAEWKIFPEAIKLFAENKLRVENDIVRRSDK